MPPIIGDLKEFEGVNPGLAWAIFIVVCLIIVVAIFSLIISIWLSIKYVVYNRTMNKANINGEQAARKILDMNGLEKIKVLAQLTTVSFGNRSCCHPSALSLHQIFRFRLRLSRCNQ